MWKDLTLVTAFLVLCVLALAALQTPLSGSIALLSTLAFASWRLHRAGERWRSLGFVRPASLPRCAAAIIGWIVAASLAAGAATLIARHGFGFAAPDLRRLGELHGNLPRLFMVLTVAWTSAAFGEELLFRGFFLTRLERALGGTQRATVIAVIGQALAFGLAHAYQGPTGMLTSGSIGLVFGIAYARGRNFWPVIVAHGIIDSVALIALYAGFLPPQ